MACGALVAPLPAVGGGGSARLTVGPRMPPCPATRRRRRRKILPPATTAVSRQHCA
eukprot:SAG25_NODE_10240_length_341_cov_1.161157_1_plen_55_part_10